MLKIKNKYSVYSLICGLIGWLYLIWLNWMIAIDQTRIFNSYGARLVQFPEATQYLSNSYKAIYIILGVIGIILGLISYRRKNKLEFIGIILSLLLLLMVFIPVWYYFAF